MNTSEQLLKQLEALIRDAKNVPLSASAMISREDALALIQQLQASLPKETDQAREIVSEKDSMLQQAQDEARRIVEDARTERRRMLSETEVVQEAEREAKRLVSLAETQSKKLKTQADDYVDAKLANFEILLNKVLRTVNRGRDQLRTRLEAAQDELPPLILEDSGEISGPIPAQEPYDQG